MSISGYLLIGKITLIAAILAAILTGILYWKLDIRKACSMLYDLPIKPKPAKSLRQPDTRPAKPPRQLDTKPVKPPRQSDTKTEKASAVVTTRSEEEPKTELLNRYETVCLYKQTFIHTSNIIE